MRCKGWVRPRNPFAGNVQHTNGSASLTCNQTGINVQHEDNSQELGLVQH